MDLRMAYEGNDLAKFEHTLHDKRNRITDDPFVMTYLDPLRQRIRESVLLHLCRPYKKITMTFMARVRFGWVGLVFRRNQRIEYTRYIPELFILRGYSEYDGAVPGIVLDKACRRSPWRSCL